MLSFLREQNDKTLHAPELTEGAGADVSADAQAQQYLTVATRNKNVRRTTSAFVVLFGIGLLCLWFMIKNSTPQTASASSSDKDETQIEIAIAQLTGASSEMFSRMDQIVKKFYESSNVLQVQVNELVKNPFELELFLSNLRGKVDLLGTDIETEMFRQQQIRQKAKDLQLKSIIKMQDDRLNCCRINNKDLHKGDLIDGFKVTQIGDNFVRLEWWDAPRLRGDKLAPAEAGGSSEPSSVESVPSNRLEVILKLSE